MEDDQYEIADLSNYIMNGRANFQPVVPLQVPDLLSGRLQRAQNYSDFVLQLDGSSTVTDMVPGGGFRPDSTISGGGGCYGGLEFMEAAGGSGRWPRQETLTLLEIRSRLDPKFKESTQKGPLWDEVSRIMSEEHGYQRTGKKCREKFDNLYKYYKKTRDGKSGRQEGKNYRFFRQLEALFGESKNAASFFGGNHCFPYDASNNVTGAVSNQDSLEPLKLSTDSMISISNDDGPSEKLGEGKKIKSKKKWKAKVEAFIDSEMRNLMEKQDDWLAKMTRMIEDKEQERLLREKEWKKLEEFRIEREQNFWATQKSWIEERNVALMETMRNLTGKQNSLDSINTHVKETTASRRRSDDDNNNNNWPECEITSLIQLRTSMEPRFHQQIECVEGILWEEVAAKMAYLGYDRNASMCKDKWESLRKYFMMEGSINNNKRKEDSTSRAYYYTTNDDYINSQMMRGGIYSSVGGINGHGNATEAQSNHQYDSQPPDHHHIRGGGWML